MTRKWSSAERAMVEYRMNRPRVLLQDTDEDEDRLTVLMAQERLHTGTSRERARALRIALRDER